MCTLLDVVLRAGVWAAAATEAPAGGDAEATGAPTASDEFVTLVTVDELWWWELQWPG